MVSEKLGLQLRRPVEGIQSKSLPVIITFVYFHKAFDRVHRRKLIEILKASGVSVEIVDAVNMMYTNKTAHVLSPDGDTEFFDILVGVLQGDTRAPHLFNITLDYAMRQAIGNENSLGFTLVRPRRRRHPAEVICDTDFADDIALL